MNRVNLIGNLTRDPEVKVLPSGKTVTNFSIAVNRPIPKDSEGQKADFIPVVAWGQTAEYVGEYLKQGNQVGVDGRLSQRSWKDTEGKSHSVVEVVADSVQSLRTGPRVEAAEKVDAEPAGVGAEEDPFA